ncbi:MAG: Crp/Fnr family transcriptional regulator [Verrucomicrobiota bacterium]
MARVFLMTEDGREITLTLMKGSAKPTFLCLCTKGVGIEFMDTTKVALLSIDELLREAGSDPKNLHCIMQQIYKYFEQYQLKIEDLAFRSVEARLARQLVLLAERFRASNSAAGVMIELNLTQDNLASLISASRPSVNIAINKLRQQGLILMHDGKIVIPSVELLKAAALI